MKKSTEILKKRMFDVFVLILNVAVRSLPFWHLDALYTDIGVLTFPHTPSLFGAKCKANMYEKKIYVLIDCPDDDD